MNRALKAEHFGLHFPISARHFIDKKNGHITTRDKDDKSCHNRSQASISPTNGYKDKMKAYVDGKQIEMKRSFTGGGTIIEKKLLKKDAVVAPTTSDIKSQVGEKKGERECLNVFEDEDLDFLN
jgi:hypothetical protein